MQNSFKKPSCPFFSCGPTRKSPSFSMQNLDTKLLERNHRSTYFLSKLKELVDKTKSILDIPDDYKVILTPASATGAIELGLWNMISKLPVNALVFDHFSLDRAILLCNELKLKDTNVYFLNNFLQGKTNNLFAKEVKTHNLQTSACNVFNLLDFNNNDTVLTLCGTSMACELKNLQSIPKDRKGLVFADATSYVFCQKIPWQSLDVIAWSLQKALGGEPSLGVLVLSPKAIERINGFKPSFPCPKVYNIRDSKGKLNNSLLDTGNPIITYSGFVLADCLLAINHFHKYGIDYFCNKVQQNFNTFENFAKNSDIFTFMVEDKSYRSLNVAYLKIKDSFFNNLNSQNQELFVNQICNLLESKQLAYDIKSYRKAGLGIRFWIGPLIEAFDIKILCKNLELAYLCTKNQFIN